MSPKSYLNENPSGINWLVVVLIVAGILFLIVLIAIFFVIPKYAEEYLNKRMQGDFDSVLSTGSYVCSSDKYNCNDFSTQAKAQAVLEYCNSTAGDIHNLDVNGNGKACESLP